MRSDAGGEELSEPTGAWTARGSPRRSGRAGIRAIVGLGLALSLVGLVSYRSSSAPMAEPQVAHIGKVLLPVAMPNRPALFAGAAAQRLAAEENPGSGENRDLYGIGDFAQPQPVLRLEARWQVATPESGSLFVDVAESASRMDAFVVKLALPQVLHSERANVEWAAATVGDVSGNRQCVAFRLTGGGDKRLSGLLCPGRDASVSETELGCLVDHLQLSGDGEAAGFDALLRGGPDARACHAQIG